MAGSMEEDGKKRKTRVHQYNENPALHPSSPGTKKEGGGKNSRKVTLSPSPTEKTKARGDNKERKKGKGNLHLLPVELFCFFLVVQVVEPPSTRGGGGKTGKKKRHAGLGTP